MVVYIAININRQLDNWGKKVMDKQQKVRIVRYYICQRYKYK